MTADIKALIAQAKRPETTVDVCLRGDLAAEYDRLADEYEKLPKTNSLSGNPDRTRIREETEAIRQQMADATVTFRLRAMREADFQDLWDAHPPRRDGDELDPRDMRMGFNRATFYEPLIRAAVVEPELDDEDWKLLLGDALTSGQKERLALAALSLNRRDVDVPFSLADSDESPS